MSDDASARGQTFTLEAFVAAILLIATVAFALQIVTVSSNTAGATEAESQWTDAGLAAGVLDRAVANDELATTLLYWNESREEFYGADGDEGHYVSARPNTTFVESLETMFGASSTQYNVTLYFQGEDDERQAQPLIESGTPGDDAVRASETVTLYDDSTLVDENQTVREDAKLENVTAGFYAPDVWEEGESENRSLYNVIRVEVVVWQT